MKPGGLEAHASKKKLDRLYIIFSFKSNLYGGVYCICVLFVFSFTILYYI